MPPLLDIPSSSLFLSHTNPPFIYQRIGDQIKIIQILGNVDSKTDAQARDEDIIDKSIEVTSNDDISPVTEVINVTKDIPPENNKCDEINDIESNKGISNDDIQQQNIGSTLVQSSETPTEPNCNTNTCELSNESATNLKSNETIDCSSIDGVSLNETYSAESDDEASFGTPDNSPKSKRKSPRPGKYGKGKAPPPPIMETQTKAETDEIKEISTVSSSNNFFVETAHSKRSLQISNPITEKKKRHKSKSPARVGKSGSSAIGKLLQLPGKFAFWNKNDDRSNSSDNSRRSSTAERAVDDFQSCIDLDAVISDTNEPIVSTTIKTIDTEIYLNDNELNGEAISQEVFDKSEELQKTITATLQSHPEYKYVPLHDDNEKASISKSTDV